MAIEQTSSGSKLESIGTVKTVVGTVKAVDPSGGERILQAGDRVFPNETIVTADGGMVLIEFANGQTMDLASGMSMVLDKDVFDPAAQASQANELTPEKIQEMIARGEDPTAITEASAAGAGAGDEGGSSFIQVAFNNTQGNVESGFETQGIPGDQPVIPEQLFPPVEAAGATIVANILSDANENVATQEDTPVEGNLLANMVNPDGPTARIASFTWGESAQTFLGESVALKGVGTLLINEDGTYIFTPAPEFNGEVPLITYLVTDGIDTVQSTLTLSVTAVNDAPESYDTSAKGREDSEGIPVELRGNDVDGTVDHFVITTLPANGTLYLNGVALVVGAEVTASENGAVVTFVPNANWNGDASFQYQSVDNDGLPDPTPATANIFVSAVNDAPETFDTNAAGVEDSEGVSVALSGSDINGEVSYFEIDSLPEHGKLYLGDEELSIGSRIPSTVNAAEVVFVPDANWTGDTSFTYHSVDNDGLSDDIPATANITISGINDAPETDNVSASGDEDSAGIPVALSGSDVDGTVDHFVITSLPANGTLYLNGVVLTVGFEVAASSNGATVIFVPNESWNGDTSFQYQSVDNEGLIDATPATATITVNSVNDTPHTTNALAQGLEDSTGIAITLAGTDSDGTVTSFVMGDLSGLNGTLFANGVAVVSGGEVDAVNGSVTLTFVPTTDLSNNTDAANFSFEYQAKDAQGGLSAPATASITVTPVTDAPEVSLTVTPTHAVDSFALTMSNVLSGTSGETTVGHPSGFTVTGYDQNGNVGTISTFTNGPVSGFGVVGEVAGNDSAFGVEASGAEKVVVALDNPATSVAYQLAFVRGSDKSGGLEKMEYVNITVHYSDGTSGTRVISGDDTRVLVNGVMKSDGVSPSFTADAPAGKTITSIEFQSASNSILNDFLVHSVSYETASTYHAVSITATPTDDDFSESITSLVVTTNEGVTLSGGTLVSTQDGISTWSLSLNPANAQYTVAIDSATGKVEVDGLKMTVPSNFSGELSVTATATAVDPGAASVQGTATWNDSNAGPTVNVTAVDALIEGQATAGEVVFNFTVTDPDSDALTLALIENSNGYLELGAQPGTIVLTQAGAEAVNANVPVESLTATLGATETNTFEHLGDQDNASLQVTAVNDAPETANTTASVEDSTPIQVHLSGSDVDGTIGEFVITSLPAHGTLFYNGVALAVNDSVPANANAAAITFVSDPGFDGQVTFQYQSVDNEGLADPTPATGTIIVDAADAPTVTVSVGAMTLNNKEINIGNVGSTDQGFHVTANNLDGSAGTVGIRTASAEQGFGINGGSSSGALPEIGQNGLSGANYHSETVTVTFDNPVYVGGIQFAWLSTIEHAKYVLKDVNGNVIGSNIVTGITDRIDPVVQIGVDGVASIEFSAPGLSSPTGGVNDDFLVHKIYFTAGATSLVDITVTPSDVDHSESVLSVKVNVPEGAHLSGGSYVETLNGQDVWEIPLSGGNGYTVTVNDTTGEVHISGLKLTVLNADANEGYTVTATGTVEDAGGSTASTAATVYDSSDNIITGADGNDEYHGGLGDDEIYGNGGNDIIDGGSGEDYLVGNAGNDIISGGNDMDVLWGGDGADTLMAGQGDDYLVGESGNDILTGGEGADMFVWQAADIGVAGAPAHDVITDFNAAEGDTIYLSDVLTAGGGLTMSAVEAEDGHLQLQFSNSNSEVVQTIDLTSVAVNGADPTALMNTLLSEGVISKD